MQNILAFGPHGNGTPLGPIVHALREQGFAVVRADLEGTDAQDCLLSLFAGRPPQIVLADLSAAPGILPLRHLHRLLLQVWADLPAPPGLTLLTPQHLSLPDWRAFVSDFLLPPYAPDEATARLRLLLFRTSRAIDDTLRFQDLVLNLASKTAKDAAPGSPPIALTPREWELLLFLVTHRGRFFSRERLLDLVWGVEYDGGERTVDIHVRRLRAKLPAEAASHLQTRRGGGYGFASD